MNKTKENKKTQQRNTKTHKKETKQLEGLSVMLGLNLSRIRNNQKKPSDKTTTVGTPRDTGAESLGDGEDVKDNKRRNKGDTEKKRTTTTTHSKHNKRQT